MKHKNKLLSATFLMASAVALISCGGDSGSSSDSKFFGKVPGIFASMTEQKEALKEQYKTCSSEDDVKKLQTEAESAEKDFSTRLEEAGKAMDGKTIEIKSTPEIKVNSPVTLTFDGFQSQLDLTPRFRMTGDVVAGQDYQSEDFKRISASAGDLSKYTNSSQHVYLTGLDDTGVQVFSQQVAFFPVKLIADSELGVKAGTKLEFETFTINEKNVEGCLKATSLQLSYSSGK